MTTTYLPAPTGYTTITWRYIPNTGDLAEPEIEPVLVWRIIEGEDSLSVQVMAPGRLIGLGNQGWRFGLTLVGLQLPGGTTRVEMPEPPAIQPAIQGSQSAVTEKVRQLLKAEAEN